jgi:predicted nucleic acid-binding protein
VVGKTVVLIAIDTSSLKRYLAGVVDVDTALVGEAYAHGEAFLPPPVVTEALSDTAVRPEEIMFVLATPVLPLYQGFWMRAGDLRRQLLLDRKAAETPDCLVAQACIDAGVPLITFDDDFRRFERAGLTLL